MKAKHPVINGKKICAKCEENKPVSEYNFNDPERGYLKNICKPCHSLSAYMNQLKNKLKNYPDKYWQCQCEWVNPNKDEKCRKCEEDKP